MKARFDYETILSIFVQFLNIVVPFLILKFNYDINGTSSVVRYEVALSLIAFFSILINYSSSIFLSTSIIMKFKPRTIYYTVIKSRFYLWLITLLILLILSIFDDESLEIYFFTSIVLFSVVFELQFYFISQSKSYIYQLLILPRTLLPLILIFFGVDLLYSISLSYLISIILQVSIFFSETEGEFRDNKRFRGAFLSTYKINTFTDLLSAVFSQLDTFIVSYFLNDSMSLIYITLKKVIRVVMSLLNYVFRSMYFTYIKLGKESAAFKGKLLTANVYIIIAYIFYFIFWDFLVFDLLSISNKTEEWSLSVFIFSFIIVLGYVKSLVVHLYLYTNRLFICNMSLSITVLILYISAFFIFPSGGDLYFSILNRVLADLAYLLLFLAYYKLKLKP